MNILYPLIFSNGIFTGYWVVIMIIYGILPSVSHSYYSLPDKYKGIFTLTLYTFAIPMIIVGEHGLMFLSGAAICFVGAAADYREELTDDVHYYSAVISILAGIAYWGFVHNAWYIGIPIVLSAVILYPILKQRATLWVELIAYYCITVPFYFLYYGLI